jgi:hypothetical protein
MCNLSCQDKEGLELVARDHRAPGIVSSLVRVMREGTSACKARALFLLMRMVSCNHDVLPLTSDIVCMVLDIVDVHADLFLCGVLTLMNWTENSQIAVTKGCGEGLGKRLLRLWCALTAMACHSPSVSDLSILSQFRGMVERWSKSGYQGHNMAILFQQFEEFAQMNPSLCS